MPCVVRSSNLVQELGIVSNVFSDKTGTPTRNKMKFVKFVVDGSLYDLAPQSEAFKSDGTGSLSDSKGKVKAIS